MQRRLALIALTAAPASAFAAEKASTSIELRLNSPVVVILLDSPAEQAVQHKLDPNYGESTSDFGYYTNQMLNALKGHKAIKIRWSHAQRVTFPGTKLAPLKRSEIGGGWGYIFFNPGKTPFVVHGVATSDELICRARAMFGIAVEGYKCEV
jgi:hypothetical protein